MQLEVETREAELKVFLRNTCIVFVGDENCRFRTNRIKVLFNSFTLQTVTTLIEELMPKLVNNLMQLEG